MAAQQADSSYERLETHHKLKLPDAVAQSIGFMGPVFSIAFLIPLLVGINAASKGAGGAEIGRATRLNSSHITRSRMPSSA